MQLNPYYVVGFTDADGCFTLNIRRWKKNQSGFSASAAFMICQRTRYRWVLELIRDVLGCGTVINKSKQKRNMEPQSQYHVTNIRDITTKIIPFFKKYPVVLKKKDFEVWCKGIDFIKNKKHLTKEGILELVRYREKMNIKKGQYRVYTRAAVNNIMKD